VVVGLLLLAQIPLCLFESGQLLFINYKNIEIVEVIVSEFVEYLKVEIIPHEI
jgi:hypothetical protein